MGREKSCANCRKRSACKSLCDEVRAFIAQGYRAIKLRLGDTVKNDIARVRAVRRAFPEVVIMTDPNAAY